MTVTAKDALYQNIAEGDIVVYYSGFYEVTAIAAKPSVSGSIGTMIKIRLVGTKNRQKTVSSKSVVKIDPKVWTMYNLSRGAE